jgi:solute carrier family 39 (zinc transporter), member 1/2/3
VAGDSFFLTLFVVIIFHQMFEGLALGSRIAALGTGQLSGLTFHSHGQSHTHGHPLALERSTSKDATNEGMTPEANASLPSHIGGSEIPSSHVSMTQKLSLAAAFALVTPLGMAIGIGTLHRFNGNDPSTIVAIGTLDAFSAGILLWVGVVEMWAADWVFGGEMTEAGAGTTFLGMFGLLAGMVVMSVLAKWA